MANHLLAIDDDPELLTIINRIGESSGYKVDTTTDPEKFKAIVSAGGPSIIMIDLQMPGYDGVKILDFLADEKCKSVIVLASGFDARVVNITAEMGKKRGLNMALPLPKPIRSAALKEMLDRFRECRFEVDATTLRQAIDENQLELFYQPLIDLSDRRLVGWEGLVRWRHPQQGLIMPERFIPVVGQVGLMDPLSNRVAELAVRQLAEWRRDGRDSFVSINISAENLADTGLPDQLERLCTQHQVPTSLLRLELTETAAMADPIRMIGVLTRLRLKGFELAIDDFGTGYSSLIQLHRLPFSELKIDQSFVRMMGESEEARLIVDLTINLARGLHMQLIAEGVETGDLADQLAAQGCDIAQGYHFSKPMPAGDTGAWITRNAHSP